MKLKEEMEGGEELQKEGSKKKIRDAYPPNIKDGRSRLPEKTPETVERWEEL